MADGKQAKATICVVNYKTLEFTKLCLRGIRNFTKYPYEVIVVDNDSRDESLEYLRSLGWIRLLERSDRHDKSGGCAHGAALDLALENCNTDFFISMHSDTFVQKANWLTKLMSYFERDESIACVGSGKLELRPNWQQWLRRATDYKTFRRRLLQTPDVNEKFRYYNRTLCCLYRMDVLKRENLTFLMGRNKGFTPGKKLYFELVDRGYKTVELPASSMSKYVLHLAHATEPVIVHDKVRRKRTERKFKRRLDAVWSSKTIQRILADASLDM